MQELVSTDDDALADGWRLAEPVAAPLPRITPSELLQAAAKRRRRAVQVRVACSSVMIVVAGTFAFRSSVKNGAHTKNAIVQAAPTETIEVIQAELVRLKQEAAIQEQVVRGLERSRSLRRWRQASYDAPHTDEASSVLQESARTAAISWRYAAMVERDLGDRAAAIREYRRVAERFAGTEWADLAANSLKRLSATSEPSPSS
jgi:hypothetical protein